MYCTKYDIEFGLAKMGFVPRLRVNLPNTAPGGSHSLDTSEMVPAVAQYVSSRAAISLLGNIGVTAIYVCEQNGVSASTGLFYV